MTQSPTRTEAACQGIAVTAKPGLRQLAVAALKAEHEFINFVYAYEGSPFLADSIASAQARVSETRRALLDTLRNDHGIDEHLARKMGGLL